MHDRAGTLCRARKWLYAGCKGATYQEPEERCFEEVHLRRDEARSLPALVFWNGQAGLHAHDRESYCDKYCQGPESERPTEANTFEEGLEEEREGES